jgi:hypothetical protein
MPDNRQTGSQLPGKAQSGHEVLFAVPPPVRVSPFKESPQKRKETPPGQKMKNEKSKTGNLSAQGNFEIEIYLFTFTSEHV